jgi:hypothetical protein
VSQRSETIFFLWIKYCSYFHIVLLTKTCVAALQFETGIFLKMSPSFKEVSPSFSLARVCRMFCSRLELTLLLEIFPLIFHKIYLFLDMYFKHFVWNYSQKCCRIYIWHITSYRNRQYWNSIFSQLNNITAEELQTSPAHVEWAANLLSQSNSMR